MSADEQLPQAAAPIDREALRAELRVVSEEQRRILLERVAEDVSDSELERLCDGVVLVERSAPAARQPTLAERVDAHIAATRTGDYRGDYELRNRHGQRAPDETKAWVAATRHLFDLGFDQATAGDAEARAALRKLAELVVEVDERVDECVVFEDWGARFQFSRALESVRGLQE